jgi:hypothetical protein
MSLLLYHHARRGRVLDAAFKFIETPADGSVLLVDAADRIPGIGDNPDGFGADGWNLTLNGGAYPIDQKGCYCVTSGAAREYEPAHTASIKLNAPTGFGVNAQLRLRVLSYPGRVELYNESWRQVGDPSVADACPLAVTLPFGLYVIQVINDWGTAAFDGITLHR